MKSNNINYLVFLFQFLLLSTLNAQQLWQINKDTIIQWHYVDGDEFNDSVVNTNKWSYQFGWARSIAANKEQQYYTDGENHKLKNGCLNLIATKKTKEAKLIDYLPESDSIFINENFNGLNKRTFEYLSGMLQSKTKFQYGYFEIKLRYPKEKGFWPAFWLYGGIPNEEIDWLEGKTEKVNKIHVGRHSKIKSENKYRHGFSIKKKWWGTWIKFNGNLNEGFHIISGEWDKNYLKFYLNGECIAYSKLKMDEPKHLVVNLAVPSNDGSFKPGPDKNSIESIIFEVDYIRIWSGEKSNSTNSKTNFTSTTSEIQKTRLISKSSMHYGKKADHENEGIIISLFPITENEFELRVLGKKLPSDAKFKIVENENVKCIEELKFGAKKIIIGEHQKIKLEAYGKEFTIK
jgi:beta-glucanase (GH16 family)